MYQHGYMVRNLDRLRGISWPAMDRMSVGTIALITAVPVFGVIFLVAGANRPYETISLMLSGLALCAVSLSIAIQARQSHIASIYAARQMQFDLIRMEIDDKSLHEVFELTWAQDPDRREIAYAHMWMIYWYSGWRVREINDHHVFRSMINLLENPICRDWWTSVRTFWGTGNPRTRKRFAALADEAFAVAVAKFPSVPASPLSGNS
jgi:hypothetical protein